MPKNLHERLKALIAAARPGERLPSEPKLARQLGVSRATLREAMRVFETRGLIWRRQGVGTFVARPTPVLESGLEVLESIERMAGRAGLPVVMGELDVAPETASPEVAKRLNLEPGASVLRVRRVMLVDERPAAYLVDVVPEGVLTAAEVNGHFTGSVLDLLLERGSPPLKSSRCEISSVAADSEVARALHIQRGDALLHFESVLYALDGRPVAYALSYFLPGYFRFHVIRQPVG